MIRSRAKKTHYDPGDGKILCNTTHGHKITLSKEEEQVTCKICLFHLGLHSPTFHYPSVILKHRAETRLQLQRLAQARLERLTELMNRSAGEQLSFL